MDESFDDQFYIVSLPFPDSYSVCTGKCKKLYLSDRLTLDWLSRHMFVGICSYPQKIYFDSDYASDSLECLYQQFSGIIGMAEVIRCDNLGNSYDLSAGFKYHLGLTELLPSPFPYKKRAQVSFLPIEIRDRFLEHTGFEVW